MTLQRGRVIKKLQRGEKVSAEELDSYHYKDEDPWMNMSRTSTETEKKHHNVKILAVQVFLNEIFNWNEVCDFFKVFPKQFFTIDVFFAYLLIILSTLIIGKCPLKRVVMSAGASFFLLLLLNYYMYINNRYLKHRVDIGVLLMTILTFLYCILGCKSEIRVYAKIYITGCISLILILLAGKYKNYSEDIAKIDDLTMEHNKFFSENAGEDHTYCYLFAATSQDGVYQNAVFYDAFDVPKVGVSRNCFYGNNLYDAARRREFGIKNLYSEITDHNIYFVMREDDTNQDAWETYFSEHSGKEVSLTLVKKYMKKNIYLVYSKPLEELIDLTNVSEGKVINQIKYDISGNHLIVSGAAYLKGCTGFSQNSYIQIVDKQTGSYELYNTIQTCDADKEINEEGYFANISAYIELPDFFDEGDEINLIIEQNNNMYKESFY